MATYTIRKTGTGSGSGTGYITVSTPVGLTVSSANIPLTTPAMTVRGQTSIYANSLSRRYSVYCPVYKGSTFLRSFVQKTSNTVANNTVNATIPAMSLSQTLPTSRVFDSSNKDTRNATLTVKTLGLDVEYYLNEGGETWASDDIYGNSEINIITYNLTLNAPPTFTSTQVSFDTSYVYTGLTTASVSVSALSAKYGGDISEVKLTIGNQSVTRADAGTLSILLASAGTFTPTVSVTDSRGQVTTKTLDAITVNGYTAPSVSFNVQRTTSAGVPNDEGTCGTLSASFTFTDVVAQLTQPTVKVDGTTASVTWYSTRATDGTLSGSVNWSSLTSPATVYGIVSAPNIQTSYQIEVTPNDSISSGTPITQTLASAFYTIDFLAGGHGIAFGQPATQDGFECNMPTTFHDTVDCEDTLTAPDMTTQEVSDFVDSLDVGGSGVAVDLVVEQGTMSSEAITRNDLKAVLDEVLPIKPEVNDCAVFHTAVVTYDRFLSDGYGGYVDASTIGVSDLTKYHWFIGEQPLWRQHNQIQSVSANEMLLRCWQMTSPNDGKVVLMRNTKPASFRLIGIKKYSD